VPAVLGGVGLVSNLVVAKYPADLVINFNNGTAITSEEKAYALPLPSEIFSEKEVAKLRDMGIENLAVVDTRANFDNIGQWQAAKSFVMLTRNAIVSEDRGGYKVQPLPRDFKATVDKALVEKWVKQLMPIVRVLVPLLIVLGFVALSVANFAAYFIVALVAGLIIWLVALLMKRRGQYREFLTAAIYAVTLAIVVDFFFLLLSLPAGGAGMRTLLITVLVWMVNVEIWKTPDLPVADSPSPLPEIKQ
jgi:hypothetical protein